MSLPAVERLIRERAGLNPAVLGGSVLTLAVQRRAKALGLKPNDYPRALGETPGEMATLLAELVVPETWFFRGGRPLFEFLGGWLRDRSARRPVRVLSVPCSTGEEPYTLALAARQAGVAGHRCAIDAVDLDAANLEKAAAGLFPRFSFRPPDSADLYQTFTAEPDGRFGVPADARALVRFVGGNLADEAFLADAPPYDLIVCRNLFIYLTPDAQTRAAAALDRLLVPDGLLALSATEADRLPPGRFAADGPPEFLVFKRAEGRVPVVTPGPMKRPTAPAPLRGRAGGHNPSPTSPRSGEGLPAPLSPSGRGVGGEGTAPTRAGGENRVGGVRPTPNPSPQRGEGDRPPSRPANEVGVGDVFNSSPKRGEPDTLAAARALADAGQLDRARAACEAVLAAGPTADAYALLGLVSLGRGAGDDALEAFRKALYLNPDHPEALAHMAVWHDRRGEKDAADRLRRRLARAEREAGR